MGIFKKPIFHCPWDHERAVNISPVVVKLFLRKVGTLLEKRGDAVDLRHFTTYANYYLFLFCRWSDKRLAGGILYI